LGRGGLSGNTLWPEVFCNPFSAQRDAAADRMKSEDGAIRIDPFRLNSKTFNLLIIRRADAIRDNQDANLNQN